MSLINSIYFYFSRQISNEWFLGLIVILVLGCLGKYDKRNDKELKKIRVAKIVLDLYIYFLLVVLLLGRSTNNECDYKLKLFWSYTNLKNSKYFVYQVVANIVLFIPVGYLLQIVQTSKSSLKLTTIIVLLGTLGIEVIQVISKRGYFELDDIFHNTLGTCIGYGYYKLKIRRKQREKGESKCSTEKLY